MSRRRANTTKLEIIQLATEMILSKGYTATTPKRICDELDISTGNLTYYFPTKEHLLAELTQMLCSFQWKIMQHMVDEGATSLLAMCLELATMAAMCEDSEIAKDFYLSTYSSPITLDIIRKNDAKRAKDIFGEYCPDWTDEQYAEAEILVSGIEYATLMTTDLTTPLESRIAGALNSILQIFNVPEETRRSKISKVLATDYRTLGKRLLDDLRAFVRQTNEQTLEEVFHKDA